MCRKTLTLYMSEYVLIIWGSRMSSYMSLVSTVTHVMQATFCGNKNSALFLLNHSGQRHIYLLYTTDIISISNKPLGWLPWRQCQHPRVIYIEVIYVTWNMTQMPVVVLFILPYSTYYQNTKALCFIMTFHAVSLIACVYLDRTGLWYAPKNKRSH